MSLNITALSVHYCVIFWYVGGGGNLTSRDRPTLTCLWYDRTSLNIELATFHCLTTFGILHLSLCCLYRCVDMKKCKHKSRNEHF
jgi:hypothetical protein